ncbi:hypothetical protein NKJ60_07755, partial [Mesorhizobium sp. M0085]
MRGRCPAGQRGARQNASLAFLLVFQSLLLLPLTALAAALPALTGRVVDNAGIIDAATETALTQ